MDLGIARALHVIGVVLWIGGVAMVTTVLIAAAESAGGNAVALLERLERRFAAQSRWTTLIVGATGLYLVERLGLWYRFLELRYWWMHAMVLVWAIFTLMLFVLEPLILHRWIAERGARDPAGTLHLISIVHWTLLALSLATVAGAVAGSHGYLLFRP